MMRKVSVLRCPTCGSTDVYCDESRSFVDISCFVCRTCAYYNFADSWQRDLNWYTEIELAEGDEIPAKVAPLDPADEFP